MTLPAQAKPQLLDTLARRAAAALHIAEPTILNAILQREALGSTGVGQGVAIPHARVPGLGQFFVFSRLDQAVDFAAVDGQPVDLVFLLLNAGACLERSIWRHSPRSHGGCATATWHAACVPPAMRGSSMTG